MTRTSPAARDRGSWFALAALLALAVLLRIIPLSESHEWDETVFLQHAKIMVDGRTNYDEFHHRPPALSALYALGFLAWDHTYAAQLLQGLASGLAVLFVFLYAQRAFGRPAALAAAVAMAFSPYFVAASHNLLTDMPAVTVILAAMWLFERRRGRDDFLSGLLFALAILTRYTSTFFGLYFLLTALSTPRRWRSLLPFSVAALAGLTPYLVWSWHRFGNPLYPLAHARRIVTEWTAPVPAGLYFDGLFIVFPFAVLVFFALGAAVLAGGVLRLYRDDAAMRTRLAGLRQDAPLRQGLILLAWGMAFFLNMLTIPHKEVRYLLPLAIPVVLIGALGFQAVLGRVMMRRGAARWAGLALMAALLLAAFAPSLQRIGHPWVDSAEWDTVRIARYIRETSSAEDVIYAAHEFPVLAFYSGRKTISVLPIQEGFEREWQRHMDHPGFFVHYAPSKLGEVHSQDTHFQPDQAFIDAHPNFRLVKSFRQATVYRYEPGALR